MPAIQVGAEKDITMTTTNKALALWLNAQPNRAADTTTLVAQGIGDTGSFVLEYNGEQDSFVLYLVAANGAGETKPLDLSVALPAAWFRDALTRRPGALNS